MDLIIDGYNVIGNQNGLQGTLELRRNWLLQQLSRYQKLKKFNLIVVFDGWRSGKPMETSAKQEGLSIVYSRLGEKADSVIVRIAREKGGGATVVTSDREIRNAVERFGAVAVYAGEFNAILRCLDAGQNDDEIREDEVGQNRSGNPNRLSKSERNRLARLKKLRI